jgi:hypothetical protein
MQCGRPGWGVFYVLILELMHDVESHSDDINDEPVWVRAGVGFIISDSWFFRKGVEGEGMDYKEIHVVSHDSSRYGEVFYPFICNTEGNSGSTRPTSPGSRLAFAGDALASPHS